MDPGLIGTTGLNAKKILQLESDLLSGPETATINAAPKWMMRPMIMRKVININLLIRVSTSESNSMFLSPIACCLHVSSPGFPSPYGAMGQSWEFVHTATDNQFRVNIGWLEVSSEAWIKKPSYL